MEAQNSVIDKVRNWFKHSLFIKTLSIGFIMLMLMIPNGMIRDLINERKYHQQSVIQEVSQKWGSSQKIIGPVLTLPYTVRFVNEKGVETTSTHYSYHLPDQLNINGQVVPNNRKRGIYQVVLYQSALNCSGSFDKINFQALNIDEKDILWDQAYVMVSIPDMAGINDNIIMNWNGDKARMTPGIDKNNQLESGVKVPVKINGEDTNFAFNFDLNINGSESLSFAPLGKETNVNLESPWASPSFVGSFLPDDRSVSESGFTASWKVLDLNRNYPQQWRAGHQNLQSSGFGVNLIQPVNEYSKNMRTAKYALLIISLTFLMFFFFEVINKQSVHPMHYILVGLALSIFYVLLLSLSEHIGFNRSYLVSGWATIGLISAYSSAVLKSRKLIMFLASILSAIFAFIFVILQLEDFALLAGSLGLFAVLALVMYFSRNIDWSNLRASAEKKEVEVAA